MNAFVAQVILTQCLHQKSSPEVVQTQINRHYKLRTKRRRDWWFVSTSSRRDWLNIPGVVALLSEGVETAVPLLSALAEVCRHTPAVSTKLVHDHQGATRKWDKTAAKRQSLRSNARVRAKTHSPRFNKLPRSYLSSSRQLASAPTSLSAPWLGEEEENSTDNTPMIWRPDLIVGIK